MFWSRIVFAFITAAGLLVALMLAGGEPLLEELVAIDVSYVAAAVGLIVANSLLGMIRLRAMLAGLHYRTSWRATVIAFIVGQVANQFILNVIGQSVSRGVILRKAGVPFGATVIITVSERMLALFVLLMASLPAAWILVPEFGFSLERGGAYFISLMVGASVTAGVVIATTAGVGAVGRAVSTLRTISRWFWLPVIITIAAHCLMLAAYLFALRSIGVTEIDSKIAAALLIVMFAASLPFSLGGWGVRELAAVAALGAVGIEPSAAMSAAVVVGAISLSITLLGTVAVPLIARRHDLEPRRANALVTHDWNARFAVGCAILIAIGVFFQVRMTTQAGVETTANAADPVALLALGLGLLFFISRRGTLPLTSGFGLAIALMSGVILYGFLLGYSSFGSNRWALLNRGLGWLVLLGYIASAASVTAIAGEAGRTLVLRVFITAGATIAGTQLLVLSAVRLGLSVPTSAFTYPLSGYAGNSNAFALQMTLVAVAAFAAARASLITWRWSGFSLIVALTALATYFSHSRSGMVLLIAALILFVTLAGPGHRMVAARSCGVALMEAVAGILLIGSLPGTASLFSDFSDSAGSVWFGGIAPRIGLGGTSDTERWMTLTDGWHLWMQSPVFGNGLGAYIEGRITAGEDLIVIHSAPVWLLAETGAVGFMAVLAAVFLVLRDASSVLGGEATRAWAAAAIIGIICAAIGNLVHDLFYQRIFWFFLALCCALPMRWRSLGAQIPVQP